MIRQLKKLARYLWRSVQTGRFVTRDYAEKHPDVTSKERIR